MVARNRAEGSQPSELFKSKRETSGAAHDITALQSESKEVTDHSIQHGYYTTLQSRNLPSSVTNHATNAGIDSTCTRISLMSATSRETSCHSQAEAIKSDIKELLQDTPRLQRQPHKSSPVRKSQSISIKRRISQPKHNDSTTNLNQKADRSKAEGGGARHHPKQLSSTSKSGGKPSDFRSEPTNRRKTESNIQPAAQPMKPEDGTSLESPPVECLTQSNNRNHRNRPRSVDLWGIVSVCPRLLLFLPCECTFENPCIQLCHSGAPTRYKNVGAELDSQTGRVTCSNSLACKPCHCEPCMSFHSPSWSDVPDNKTFVKEECHNSIDGRCSPEAQVEDRPNPKKKKTKVRKNKEASVSADPGIATISFLPPTPSTIPAIELPSLVISSKQAEPCLQLCTKSSLSTKPAALISKAVEFPPLGNSAEVTDSWLIAQKKTTPSEKYAAVISKDLVVTEIRRVVRRPSKYEQWDAKERNLWIQQNLSVGTRKKYTSYPGVKRQAVTRAGHNSTAAPQFSTHATDWHCFPMLPAEIQTLIWQFSILKSGATVYVRYEPSTSGDTGKIQYVNQECRVRNVCRETRYLCDNYHRLRFRTATERAEVPFHFKSHKLFIHNAASVELGITLMSMMKSDRNQIRYLCIPLRDFIASRDSTIKALCECANLLTVWFVSGQSVQDQEFLEEHYKSVEGLRKYIKSYLHPCWKRRWSKNLDYPWVKDKIPKIEFDVVGAFKAAEMKIDNLQWL